MTNINTIDWNEPVQRFDKHFGYCCQIPLNAEINSENDYKLFSELVDKCIADNVDYTIEKYGTVPPKNFDLPNIIID